MCYVRNIVSVSAIFVQCVRFSRHGIFMVSVVELFHENHSGKIVTEPLCLCALLPSPILWICSSILRS
jgi:hypothetical protein